MDGGYAGVMAANHLTQRDDLTVTLVNPRATIVERIRLHQLVGGSYEAVVDYREILGEGIRLMVDTVTRINAPSTASRWRPATPSAHVEQALRPLGRGLR